MASKQRQMESVHLVHKGKEIVLAKSLLPQSELLLRDNEMFWKQFRELGMRQRSESWETSYKTAWATWRSHKKKISLGGLLAQWQSPCLTWGSIYIQSPGLNTQEWNMTVYTFKCHTREDKNLTLSSGKLRLAFDCKTLSNWNESLGWNFCVTFTQAQVMRGRNLKVMSP